DKKLVFVIRAQTGGTERIFKHASNSRTRLADAAAGAIRYGDVGRLAVTRRVRFIWVVTGHGQISWFSSELYGALRSFAEICGALETGGIEIEASVYVTCDPILTNRPSSTEPSQREEISKISMQEELAVKVRVEEKEQKDEGVDGLQDCEGAKCCCQDVVEAEDSEKLRKTCFYGATPSTLSSDVKDEVALVKLLSPAAEVRLPEEVSIIPGRPAVKKLIRKELERARGESAVVICGPRGMLDAGLEAVIELSNERSVHKGSGAQGNTLRFTSTPKGSHGRP
ncbi:ferric-chelate reductase Frp1, partial [Rhizina undulata]